MVSWGVNFVDGFAIFLYNLGLREIDLIKIKAKMDYIAQNPIRFSEKVVDIGYPYVRRVKYVQAGTDYRVFILLNPTAEEIYCLAIFSREQAYDQKVINRVKTIIKNLKETEGYGK